MDNENNNRTAGKIMAEGGKIALKVVAKGVKSALGPAVYTVIGGVFILLLVIAIMVVAVNPQILFTKDKTTIETLTAQLEDGFIETKLDAAEDISAYIVSKHSCSGGSLSGLMNKNNYHYSSEACEIDVGFTPELEEFVEHIDAYANAVNSTLQFLEEGGSAEITEQDSQMEFTENLVTVDENGEIQLTEYGQSILDSYDSEYVSNQSNAYYETLTDYSTEIFDYGDESQWIESNFHVGKKTKLVTMCYKKKAYTGDETTDYEAIGCSLAHDKEEMVEIEIDCLYGTITVPMTYDVTKYKLDKIETAKSNMIGKVMPIPIDEASTEFEVRAVASYEEADRFVWQLLTDYEMMYYTYFTGEEYGYGYDGVITPMGEWNYLEYRVLTGPASAEFWAYAEQYDDIFHPNHGFGPARRNCTYFAATWFYDIYGYHGLGSHDGINVAAALVRSHPDQFILSGTPAPGGIISLYPNHVACIDQVEPDGAVYISEANFDGHGGVRTHVKYSSLREYERVTGWKIASIAIPRR